MTDTTTPETVTGLWVTYASEEAAERLGGPGSEGRIGRVIPDGNATVLVSWDSEDGERERVRLADLKSWEPDGHDCGEGR